MREPEQLRALGDELRSKIVLLLRDRALSTTELAEKLGLPKGTVGHHVKVLEKAGLVHVVRTRQVRAVTEKFYGRVARLFLFESTDADARGRPERRRCRPPPRSRGDASRSATTAGRPSASCAHGSRDADAKRLSRRLKKLIDDFRAAESAEGEEYGLAAALYGRAVDA